MGLGLGDTDGVALGDALGFAVGLGLSDGEGDGDTDGDGETDGDAVGLADGLALGDTEGDALGEPEGEAVGEGEGEEGVPLDVNWTRVDWVSRSTVALGFASPGGVEPRESVEVATPLVVPTTFGFIVPRSLAKVTGVPSGMKLRFVVEPPELSLVRSAVIFAVSCCASVVRSEVTFRTSQGSKSTPVALSQLALVGPPLHPHQFRSAVRPAVELFRTP